MLRAFRWWIFRRSSLRRVGRELSHFGVLFSVGATLTVAQNPPVKSSGVSAFSSARAIAATTSFSSDETCASCHQGKAVSYHQTAHFKTSGLATKESIHGNFSEGANILRTANPDLYFKMEASGNAFSQTGVLRNAEAQVLTRTETFDIVVGSGRKGQSYLFWDGEQLFQLPVSYWAELGAWVNSPGYVDGTANFDRPIAQRCLECHATSFASRAPPENAYLKSSLLLGISCEKCHGSGREHVARYRSAKPPKSLAESAIINPAKLPRSRQIDMCALCHSGSGNALTPPLSFKPGDVLAQHLVFPKLAPDAHVDVHASQVQLLERSRCFQQSSTLTCITCHDVHQPQRDPATLSSHCVTCHQVESCRQFPKQGQAIVNQCVTCHMPLQRTDRIIISGRTGKSLKPQVRNHQIAIYPKVTLP